MKSVLRAGLLAMALAGLAVGSAMAEPLTGTSLKVLLENMGYTPGVLNAEQGKEKYEVKMATTGFDVPVGLEISPSGRYIWATAFLGSGANVTGDTALALLRKNADIQPSFFYITAAKNNLMVAFAIDNRDVTPAHMKFVLEKLAADVGNTSSLWNPKPATPAAQ